MLVPNGVFPLFLHAGPHGRAPSVPADSAGEPTGGV